MKFADVTQIEKLLLLTKEMQCLEDIDTLIDHCLKEIKEQTEIKPTHRTPDVSPMITIK